MAGVRGSFGRICGLTRFSDFCRVIVLCPCVLRTTALAEPGRSPWVSAIDSMAILSSLPPRLTTDFGLAAGGQLNVLGVMNEQDWASTLKKIVK